MRSRAVLGGLLVLAGGLLLLDRAGLADAGDLLGTYWPLVLVGIGAWGLAATGWRNAGSLILVALGLVFLGLELDVLPGDVWELLWPLALIGAGVWLLAGRLRSRPPGGAGSSHKRLDAVAILGGHTERITATAWEGGDVTAIMGGVDLYLDEARPVESGAVLRAMVLMGGLTVSVPPAWEVDLQATPLLGGVEDNRARPSPGGGPRSHRLRVRATVVMGGLEIADAEPADGG